MHYYNIIGSLGVKKPRYLHFDNRVYDEVIMPENPFFKRSYFSLDCPNVIVPSLFYDKEVKLPKFPSLIDDLNHRRGEDPQPLPNPDDDFSKRSPLVKKIAVTLNSLLHY